MIKHLKGQQYRRVGFCVLVKWRSNISDEEKVNIREDWHDKYDPQTYVVATENISNACSHVLQFDPDSCDRITIV